MDTASINPIARNLGSPMKMKKLRKLIKGRMRAKRANIYAKSGGRCRYCGKELQPTEMTIDHIHPRSKGGGNHPKNLTAACKTCNSQKGDKIIKL